MRTNFTNSKVGTLILVTVASLILASVSLGEETGRRDGNWWITLTETGRLNYAIGFFDGMQLGHNFSYWDFAHDDSESACMNSVAKSFSSNNKKYLGNVTNGQLVDGLNGFYSDYRNRRIEVWAAL